MNRQPVVAGQFYPGNPASLRDAVASLLALAQVRETTPSVLVMAPHAGYVYSGAVAGRTLGEAVLPETLILLGPNHTGRGAACAIWPEGRWLIPGGGLDVDAGLAQDLLAAMPRLQADTKAHDREHSLEVMIPFLHHLNPNMRIAPIAVADYNLMNLLECGDALGEFLATRSEPVGMLVSSDMSHYVPHDQARARDAKALAAALAVNPEELFQVVRRDSITMCGVLPMTLALAAARRLDAECGRLVKYSTSGEVSGDYRQVVGYAGLIFSRKETVKADAAP